MNGEEKKAIEFIKDLIAWDVRQDLCPNKEECENLEIILNLIEKLQKENEELKEEIEKYYKPNLDMFDNRKYRKKYLEERRKEVPNLLYPDGDEIYKRYYEQKKQIDLMAEELRYDEELKIEVCKDCEPIKEELCGEPKKTQGEPTELECVKQYFEKLAKEKE